MNFDWREELAGALHWWREAGLDTIVDDEPRDWLARLPKPVPTAPVPAIAEQLPTTLEGFIAWRLSDAAPEAGWRTPRIAPMGNPGASLMVVLDMPEAEDAETGMLLSGPEGRLLDRMLAAIGHSRATIFLATVAVARPLSSVIPAELEPRLGELVRHYFAMIRPSQLLFMGDLARRAALETRESLQLGCLRNINHDGGSVTAMTSLSPRVLLEQPARKADAWKHLQMLGGTGQ